MKSYAIDYYGGNVLAGKIKTGNDIRYLPSDTAGGRLIGLEGMLSSFVKLHVDTWLTKGLPSDQGDKQGPGIIGMLKSGDSGSASLCNMGLDLPLTGQPIWVNFWAHNMNAGPVDWHVGYVFYYEAPGAVILWPEGKRTSLYRKVE